MPFAEHKRWNIVDHAGEPRNKRIAANRCEVVNANSAAQRSVIVNVNVSAQQRAVCHDNVITKLAIVSNMAAGHKKIVVANPSDTVFLLGGSVDRHAFAKNIVIA